MNIFAKIFEYKDTQILVMKEEGENDIPMMIAVVEIIPNSGVMVTLKFEYAPTDVGIDLRDADFADYDLEKAIALYDGLQKQLGPEVG